MNNFRKFRKNSKAISPIFATLILIAIAVIAGVVVYMFTSGTLATMTSGGTAGQEKVSVQAASGTTSSVTLYAQSTSGPKPALAGLNVIVRDSSGNTIATGAVTTLAAGAWNGGALAQLSVSTLSATLVSGTSYTATLVTPAGGNFVSPSFTIP
jgi:flagellin-like protein